MYIDILDAHFDSLTFRLNNNYPIRNVEHQPRSGFIEAQR